MLLSHAPLDETNSVPAEEWRRGYNLTTQKHNYYIKETIELINQLIPNLEPLTFFPSQIDVNQVMEEIEQIMQLRLKNNAVTLTFDECLPECTFYMDRNRLIQLIANFVVNAIKFTEKGTIRMGYRILNPETIYFYVSDMGCGMSKEK